MSEEAQEELECLQEIFTDAELLTDPPSRVQTEGGDNDNDEGDGQDENRCGPSTVRIRLKAPHEDAKSPAWLWLKVRRPSGYPEVAATVDVKADLAVRWAPVVHLETLAECGRAVALEQAG